MSKSRFVEIKSIYGCTHNCIFCSFGDLRSHTMSAEEIYSNIQYFQKHILEPYEQLNITLSGGEFAVRRDCLEILRELRSPRFHIKHIKLHTNGTRFSDLEFTRAVSELIDSVWVSLHTLDGNLHSRITRRSTTIEQVLTGLDNLVACLTPRRVSTNTLICSFNYRSLASIAKHLAMVPVSSATFSFLFALGHAKQRYAELLPPSLEAISKPICEARQILLDAGVWFRFNTNTGFPACYQYRLLGGLPPSELARRLIPRMLVPVIRRLRPGNPTEYLVDRDHQLERAEQFMPFVMRDTAIDDQKCNRCVFRQSCLGIWSLYSTIPAYQPQAITWSKFLQQTPSLIKHIKYLKL